ncbi:2-hydroxy-3-oxopropionate reductase [Pigmentiphaga soli]|uniref:2-hydroxy-3-oxopropionate reductase n=1 Tax=Pigmentiphaga soli TaxID=1007095 RepID=A0ABP8HC39_9BURK
MLLFLGLGRMGLPMATHALRSGLDVHGYDVAAERMALFQAQGGQAVADLAAAFRAADAVMIMAGSQAQVQALFSGPQGILSCARPGTLVMVISTVMPEFVQELSLRAAQGGIRVVDAPVCRAEMGAVSGTLLAFLSGAKAACDEAAALMRPFCADIEYVGEKPGAAQVAKTINNLILWACVVANYEGLSLAKTWQLDVDSLRRALVTSSADNWSLRHWDKVSEMPWSIKDMEIALETSDKAGIELPLSAKIAELVRVIPVLTHAKVG